METKIDLQFEPVEHKYFDGETKEVYTSATTIIGKYKKPFNKEYWSMYTALKESGCRVVPEDTCTYIIVDGTKRTLDYLYKNPINSYYVNKLVARWQEMTDVACARGNKIHDYLEDSINLSKGDITGSSNSAIQPHAIKSSLGLEPIKTVHDLEKTTIKKNYPAIYNRLLLYINEGCTIYAEKKVYTSTYKIAGMIDVLIVKGKFFSILDWKTNKDQMHFVSGYYKKVKVGDVWVKSNNFIPTNDTLLYPLDSLASCKGIVYSLQLSLYAYIMELWGYTLIENGLEIFHLRPGLEPKLIKVKYYKKEIKAMLEHSIGNYNKPKPTISFGVKR